MLETERLILRPPEPRDVAAITTWIGDYDVAKNLSRVPHPYRETDARDFIARAIEQRAAGSDYAFSVTRKSDDACLGGCGVHLRDGDWEFGYWLGKPYWGNGYATEAAGRLAAFAFDDLGLEPLTAGWFHDNPVSKNVLIKLGARPNGEAMRDCLSRGEPVLCHLVLLTGNDFERNNVARKAR